MIIKLTTSHSVPMVTDDVTTYITMVTDDVTTSPWYQLYDDVTSCRVSISTVSLKVSRPGRWWVEPSQIISVILKGNLYSVVIIAGQKGVDVLSWSVVPFSRWDGRAWQGSWNTSGVVQ